MGLEAIAHWRLGLHSAIQEWSLAATLLFLCTLWLSFTLRLAGTAPLPEAVATLTSDDGRVVYPGAQ